MKTRGTAARRRWSVAAAAVLLVIALAAFAMVIVSDGSELASQVGVAVTYEDARPEITQPDGPLMAGVSGRTSAGWTGMLAQYDREDPTLTFSFPVCLRDPGAVAITDLQPLQVVGTDFELVGTLLHDRLLPTSGPKTLTGSQQGYPPADLDPALVQPLEGAEVTVPCGLPATRAQEVVFGLRATGADGGGWRGAILTYTTPNGTSHRLIVPQESLLCGTSNEPCRDRMD